MEAVVVARNHNLCVFHGIYMHFNSSLPPRMWREYVPALKHSRLLPLQPLQCWDAGTTDM